MKLFFSFFDRSFFVFSFFVCLFILSCGFCYAAEYDVVVYGGTSSAVTTAIQVKKMGKSVIIVSPDKHLGGLSSGGLGFTDSGRVATVGGLAREFYHRIYLAYLNDNAWQWQKRSEYGNVGQGVKAILHEDQTMWIFEPHIAEIVFDKWIEEYKIPVVREALLDREKGVVKKGPRIVSITTCDGKTYTGQMFIDATYEGDLMATAGVSYHVGRESNTQYGEKWNGNQVGIYHHRHWFAAKISPYVVPDDPTSGLLPYIDKSEPGIRGNADQRIQAYNFRICMTQHPANRIPFPKPKNYDPAKYEIMNRLLASGWREMFSKYDPIPNLKTDTNNHGPFSSDFIGMNYEYPEASYQRRAEIIREHREYQQGLLYYQANDPKVPEDIRRQYATWGLAKDEFSDNGNWPWQIYVREARRMIGEYVVTEHDCFKTQPNPMPESFKSMRRYGSVGQGSYALDSHNVRRYVTPEGFIQNEGDIGVSPKGPYPVDYGAIVPKKKEAVNLLVPVCVSSSHIAFGSIRMEPVFMILGQSAGTAACMAIDRASAVQDLDYESLSKQLKTDGQRL